MAVFKKFEGSNASRYNNSLHAAYHTAQLKQLQAVAEETLETMHVSGEQLEGYVITVDDLTERSMEAQASTSTGDTTALDVERDRLLSMLFFLVASGLLSAVAEEQAAAKTLDVILRVYKGIQGKAMDVETQMIRGLLVDLKKDEAAAAVTTLRLNEILTQLETVNDKFEEVKDVRVKDRQAKHLQVKTQDLRLLADTQLEEIQDLIRATGIIAATDPESAVLLGMVNDLIDGMNGVTRNFKTVFNQSTAQKEANKKPDEGESDDGNLEFVPVEK
ncbi:MAG: DUF6261 family protein [Parabacteroides sp.]|nr:DUF6261 family protein [Parabacteroides sp.]